MLRQISYDTGRLRLGLVGSFVDSAVIENLTFTGLFTYVQVCESVVIQIQMLLSGEKKSFR